MRLAQRMQLLIDRALPEAKQRQFAADYARGLRDGLIRSGVASPFFSTEVDGRAGAAEESVRLDGGRIVYRFHGLARAVQFVLDYLQARSPVLTGEYKRSWIVLVGGSPWRGDLGDIPADAEVVVTNDRPWHRLFEVGSNGKPQTTQRRKHTTRKGVTTMRVIGATEDAMRQVRQRFPGVWAQRRFVRLSGGKNDAPWIRKDGQEVTYPAVVLRIRPGG